jgi:hypothetical protein
MVEMVKVAIFLMLGSWMLQTPQRPPRPGVKTPGVRIPIERLKPDAVFPVPGTPDWLAIDEAVWVSNKPKNSVSRLDPKTNTARQRYVGKARVPGGAGSSLWVPNVRSDNEPRISRRRRLGDDQDHHRQRR